MKPTPSETNAVTERVTPKALYLSRRHSESVDPPARAPFSACLGAPDENSMPTPRSRILRRSVS